MDIANIKQIADSLKRAVIDGNGLGHAAVTEDGFTINVYCNGLGYAAVLYIDDVDANARRWLHHMEYWVYQTSVDVLYADTYGGSVPDSRFAYLSRQAEEDERKAAVDVAVLPGRLAMAAAVKANLYHDEASYWRALDRKARRWARNQALTGRGDRARLAARLADALGGSSEFSYADAGFDVGAYWRVSWEL